MIVRLRFKPGPPKRSPAGAIAAEPPPAPGVARGLAAILTPAAVLAVSFALWRLGADLGLAHEFLISEGVLSRWQVWFAVAAVLQGAAFVLNRRSAA